MAIINGRRIQVPPAGITGQNLIQQVNPGLGFAVLLGKTQQINGSTIITVIDILFPAQSDYNQQSVAFLRIKKDFIHKALVELTSRYDVDTMIDVHTHPFTPTDVSFSATDNGDERTFFRFLKDKFPARTHGDTRADTQLCWTRQDQLETRTWQYPHPDVLISLPPASF